MRAFSFARICCVRYNGVSFVILVKLPVIHLESSTDFNQLAEQIKVWGQDLGFAQVAIAPIDLEQAGKRLNAWLKRGYHGEMRYLAQHGSKRYRPAELLPGTVRVICVRMQHWEGSDSAIKNLKSSDKAYISRYARGRDYHKVMRKRLNQLAQRINATLPEHQYRAFVDSAPVMEKPLASACGLGWQGKHTIVINPDEGSWFFLGCLFTNLPLPVDQPVADRCGRCQACIKVCPTGAIKSPYVLDATRCISYLTIEQKGSIPESLRRSIGNRIFGCDDCQLICPWNRYAVSAPAPEFTAREHLNEARLVDLFAWTETEFEERTRGSAIRRTGYIGWLRNLAVALGNAPPSAEVKEALRLRLHHPSALVREHVIWALQEQRKKTIV